MIARLRPAPWLIALAALWLAATGTVAVAQGTRSDPGPSYFATIEELYRGEYQQAERGFQNEVRGGIRVGLARWVDSICYRAMLGETLYQMGRPREALVQFDAACELFLSYPRWMIAVRFQNPRPDNNIARRTSPWGGSTRRPTYGVFTETMLVQQGELITEQRLAQGGQLQAPQMWRLNVVEVVRATALAIRRRNEILGPLGQHDRMSKSLVGALARGDNTERNHWSTAWTELLLGLAQQGVGESQQALAHLTRATLVDGRFDHPLTGAALYAQAVIAMEAGNADAALNLATEASYAAFAYEDYDILGVSLELAHQAWMARGGEGVMPALPVAAQWADRQNLHHLSADFFLLAGEELAASGDAKGAANMLTGVSPRRRDLRMGRLAPEKRYVEAFIAYLERNDAVGDKAATEAIALEGRQSLRHLQIALANQRVDGGQLSTRVAVDVYALLLRDPAAADWAASPLGTLTNLSTSYEGAMGRWMLAALGREEVLPAIDVADTTKRRRFWMAQPLGGRLLAIRHLLESDPAKLPPTAAAERRNLLLRVPDYEKLLTEAVAIEAELAAQPLADAEGRVGQDRYNALKKLAKNAENRESLIRQLVLRRDPTDLLLPPAMSAKDVQAKLVPGQAVVMFHQSASSYFAFILTQQAYHHWRLPEAGPLADKTAEMLRAMGHFGANRELDSAALATDAWRPMAVQYGDMLFGESRLDLGKTTELIVIPDGVLWHAPIEPLMPSTGSNKEMVIDRTPVRYVPTLAYAAPDTFRPSPVRTTIIATATGSGANGFLPQQAAEEIAGTATGSVVIGSPVAVTSPLVASVVEQVVSLADATLDPAEPYSFIPLPLDRGTGRGTLGSWLTLPLPGCERLILAGVHTVAESGLKTRGRGRSEATSSAGPELFHASCGLLASGAKTVLLSRWQTGGKTGRELVREFVLELPHTTADEAWRRSVALARRTNLDAEQEPRFKRPAEGSDPVTADHPFLWSGYLLVDTGFNPAPPEPEPGVDGVPPAAPGAVPGAAPGAAPPVAPPAGAPGAAPPGAAPAANPPVAPPVVPPAEK
ncbi:CHAT domain-containing protein [Aeoliella sp. SH292]|uniref:CHAT domain-containing protein n=1 Tax=Aeoliella sp. SH292 TaxID=3454464 RepID=UPI003F963AA7